MGFCIAAAPDPARDKLIGVQLAELQLNVGHWQWNRWQPLLPNCVHFSCISPIVSSSTIAHQFVFACASLV